MLSGFSHLLPETIFDAVEVFGVKCTGRFLGLNAYENRVYEVEREDGSKVVIKFYRPGRWDKQTIQTEHDFLLALEKDEIPVVRPMDQNGKTLFEMQGVYFAVFPKRAGRLEAELSKTQLQRLGRFLGRLHNVGETFPNTTRTKLIPQTYGRESLAYLQKEDLIPPTAAARYGQLVNEICDRIEPWFEKEPLILLHGDCHAGNILWREDEPYFIDFDDMVYAPAVQDIWMLTGSDDEDGKKRREILLEEYETIREFSYPSLRLIEALRSLRMIYFTTWIAKRWEDGAFKLGFPHFGSEKYWQEQLESLSNQREKIDTRGYP